MNVTQIKAMQSRISVLPDGFWGPKSIAACQKHLRALMPKPNPWPKANEASLAWTYGKPGEEDNFTRIDVTGLGVKYSGKAVTSILCHRIVGPSLLRIIRELSKTHPEILAEYAGCYNNRNMRGGSSPSLHARAAAIDFAPDTNGNRASWPVSSTMPLEVMEAFAREGWISAGAFWGRDGMHHQATQ